MSNLSWPRDNRVAEKNAYTFYQKRTFMGFLDDLVELVTKVLWMTLALMANLITISVLIILGSFILYMYKELMR